MLPKILLGLAIFYFFSSPVFAEKMQAPIAHEWNEGLAKEFVQLSLTCVDQEFPNTWEKYEGKIMPKERHPAFFGCYDWHSAVHGHWAMLRVWKLFPNGEWAEKIEEIFDRHFSTENIAGELAFLKTKESFENPYGYGWFFQLLEELDHFQHPKAAVWRAHLQPIADLFLERYGKSLDLLNRPSRVGTHDNTAYSMVHIYDYARSSHDEKLKILIQAKAKEFFGNDRNCPFAYEPGPYDFISPCLIEADLMRRVLPKKEYTHWSATFFGNLKKNDAFFVPVVPKDLQNPYMVHQIGLMFQKAASMRALARGLPDTNPLKQWLQESATLHAHQGIKLMLDGGYGGTHWLASFAIYYFSGADE